MHFYPGEPSTVTEFRPSFTFVGVVPGHIVHINAATLRHFIISIHGINRLGRLCTALLVDTAGIDPDPVVGIRERQRAKRFDLPIP